jgi:hypothetical protein
MLLDFLVLVLVSSSAFLEARASEADELHTIESIAACSEVEPPSAPHQGLSAGDHLLATVRRQGVQDWA